MVVVVLSSTVEKKEGGLKELFSPPHGGSKLGLGNFPCWPWHRNYVTHTVPPIHIAINSP